MKLKLFTKSSCPPSQIVKCYLADKNVDVEIINNVNENFYLIKKHGIVPTPSLILFDEEETAIARVEGFKRKEIDSLLSITKLKGDLKC